MDLPVGANLVKIRQHPILQFEENKTMNMNTQEVTTQNASAAVDSDRFASAYLSISETDRTGPKPVRVFKEFLEYGVATLNQVSDSFPAPDKWVDETVSGGEGDAKEVKVFKMPSYADAKLQYLQDALTSSLQALARNKSKQEGAEIPMDWVGVFEQSTTAKFGTVFKVFKDTFAVWLKEHSGYTPEQSAQILGLIDLRGMASMNEASKGKLHTVVTRFIDALEDTSEIQSAITAINNALAKEEVDLGFI